MTVTIQMTRFAPAPTGRLHLGHVVNAIYVWGLARTRGARVLLRIEDHDAQRARPEYERALLDDLDWLGFAPDLFPTDAFRDGPCASRQSNRQAIYSKTAATLIERGLVYGCTCTRRDAVRLSGQTGAGPAGCAAGCARANVSVADDRAWRVRLAPSIESFDDLLSGRQEQLIDGQDPVIRDRVGNWTYTFAVCVDDLDQGVDLVIRGQDLLAATGQQIALGRLLGRPVPAAFAHHRLVMKSPTQKLSKSDGDTAVAALRERGWDAARVIGAAAAAIGLAPAGERLHAHQVPQLLQGVQPGGRT